MAFRKIVNDVEAWTVDSLLTSINAGDWTTLPGLVLAAYEDSKIAVWTDRLVVWVADSWVDAHVGDWLVNDQGQFSVYTDSAFTTLFEAIP